MISLIALLLIFVTFLYNQLNKSKKPDRVEFVIGMSQANLTEPWRISMNEEIKKEAEKFDNIKIIYRDAGGNTEKQGKDINELIGSGIDLLIVSINDSQKLTPLVSKVYKSVPVIVLDRAVEGYDYSLYIGSDNESIGKQAGELVTNLIGSKAGKVIEVQGLLNSPPVVGRSKGFRDVIKDYNNIDILRTVTCEWQKDEAEDKVGEILDEFKDIDVIFAHSDYMALGAYKAANERGIKNIKIIGTDGLSGVNGGVNLVSKGILQGTFTCPTGGREAVDYAMEILNKNEGIPKKIILKSHMITKDNVNEYISEKSKINNSNKKIVLGYAQLNSESKWRDANAKSIKNAAKQMGIDLVFLESGTTQEEQKNLIRRLIKLKVDVIAFSPLVESGWDDVLTQAKTAGIPVILSDRCVNSDSSLWVTNIGSDFFEEGRRAAKLMMNNFNSSEQVNILQIMGNTGSSPALQREEGFRDVIKDFKNYNISVSMTGNFTYDGGKKAMNYYLKQFQNINVKVVYAHNDDMALGAIEALKEYGIVPGKDIIILGTDGTKQALRAIKEKEMYCTVECNPLLGIQLMIAVRQIKTGIEVPEKIINAENVFTQDITDKEINKRQY